ncbi:DUF3667 domain-containing protein [Hymenobacter chitinivorans]|uniref:Uncharacterized protein DUF3667 n=1 Tax=Hymenobacter chitinivorans DSM 11115 TaxID=1121954 RepID=A0A2M9B5F4_9BACT|nr:DUF3667 domain-containing protein [Hymenobacter chitinivorans]PJJ53165.1 uncharacterized protein DUF3667 [Hymenobacter chitinivorans DSM 11115]
MAHSHAKLSACANCSYSFPAEQPDEFCPRCGQQNQEVSLSLGHVTEEFLEGIFHFDSKVFRTAKLLLFKPGELTKRFLAGHRMPYVPPIRLYIFISFVFFFLLSMSIGHSSSRPSKELMQNNRLRAAADSARQSSSGPANIIVFDKYDDRIGLNGMDFRQAELISLSENPTSARIDSAIRSRKLEPTFMRRLMLRQTVRTLDMSPDEMTRKWLKNLPLLMFVLMPLFALLLKGLYRRQRQYYLSHLIFSIHFHCFVFVLFILNLGVGLFTSSDSMDLLLMLLPAVYFFLALRNNFGQSVGKTLAKVLLMMTSYGVVLFTGMVLSVLVSVLLL